MSDPMTVWQECSERAHTAGSPVEQEAWERAAKAVRHAISADVTFLGRLLEAVYNDRPA